MTTNSDQNSGSTGSGMKWALMFTLFLLLAVGVTVAYTFPTASNQGYAPEQPIPYSHKLHAGQYKIDCQYCHANASKSRHATIPSLNICMNCHSLVKIDSPYIIKLRQNFTDGKPIEWVRVHELPDYVYFPHKRHVAKNITCQTCHGEIQTMERVEQFAPLTMGWCVNCHKGDTAPENVLKQAYPDMPNPKGPVAPLNCSTCHQ